jgi:hypothetical protein
MTDRTSLTWHENVPQSTVRYCPRLCTAVLLGVEALIGVASAAPPHSDRSSVPSKHALAGRADLRDNRPPTRAGWLGADKVGHPFDLPEGYHAGLRQVDGMPHQPPACKIIR